MRSFFLNSVFIFSAFSVFAQDIHWSQFDYNPIFQNPANSGFFSGGNYRFHSNYRDQWRSVTIPFQTLNLSADTRGLFHDNLGLGAYFFHDVAGDGKFRTVEFTPSASWLLPLTADSVHLLRLGGQVGINYRQFNADAFTFNSQWNGIFFDQSMPTNEQFLSQSRTNVTFGLGAVYEMYKGKRERYYGGVGLFNINKPNHGFFGEDIPRERRLNMFAAADFKIDLDWDLMPSIQFNWQGTYLEFLAGSRARYIMKDRMGDYLAVVLGGYMRITDAAMLMGGVEWQNWWFGMSYDVNFSKLAVASRARGGLEFSARYILRTFKPSDKIFRVCPDYI